MLLKEGDEAPDFTVLTHHGSPLTLSSLRGRKVLMWFYPRADTPGWTIEGRGFRDQLADFEGLNITVLGVSLDKVEDNAAFADKNGIKFQLLCDTERAVSMAYGACDSVKAPYANRISYLIDEQGKIAKVYAQVNPRQHAAQVLADVIDATPP